MELTEDMCKRSGREVVRARKLLDQVVVCRMGYSDAEVARFHGITTSAVSLGKFGAIAGVWSLLEIICFSTPFETSFLLEVVFWQRSLAEEA